MKLGLAGAATEGSEFFINETDTMVPSRPLWLAHADVVFRDKLLEKFRGLLTYGSPLDKFAAIWPHRAPINVKERMFQKEAEWINVYDPTDPVAARLVAFSQTTKGKRLPDKIIVPRNLGYRASPWLLLSHIRYLGSDLADSVVGWMLSGNKFQPSDKDKRWLHSEWLRRAWAALMWVAVFALLIVLAAWMLPEWISWGIKAITALGRVLSRLSWTSAVSGALTGNHPGALELARRSLGERSGWVVRWSLVITFCIGVVGWIYFYIQEKWIAGGNAASEERYWIKAKFAGELISNLIKSIPELFVHRAGGY